MNANKKENYFEPHHHHADDDDYDFFLQIKCVR